MSAVCSARVHDTLRKRMLDVAKGGMKALVCDPVTVRAIDDSTTLRFDDAFDATATRSRH